MASAVIQLVCSHPDCNETSGKLSVDCERDMTEDGFLRAEGSKHLPGGWSLKLRRDRPGGNVFCSEHSEG